jgi:hypothetical protein
VNVKCVHRFWKAEGLQIRKKQRKRRRLGNSNNACHRHKAEHKDHVWSYDFVSERTEKGGRLRLLNIVDEFTRECLTIEIARRFTGKKVVEVLKELFAIRGCPKFIRSDNGPEFACQAVKKWLMDSGVGLDDARGVRGGVCFFGFAFVDSSFGTHEKKHGSLRSWDIKWEQVRDCQGILDNVPWDWLGHDPIIQRARFSSMILMSLNFWVNS